MKAMTTIAVIALVIGLTSGDNAMVATAISGLVVLLAVWTRT